jgi:hypothetical protein
VEKTWKPTVAGILCIVGGIIGLLVGIFWALVALSLMGDPAVQGPGGLPVEVVALWIWGGIASMMAIIGGIYALRRRRWRLALAGSICALFSLPVIFGFSLLIMVGYALAIVVIPAILPTILVVRGKREFDQAPEFDKAIELNPDGGDAYGGDH